MPTPITNYPTTWQGLYTSERSRWNSLKNIFWIFTPLSIGLFISFAYIVYIFDARDWLNIVSKGLSSNNWFSLISITLIALPILFGLLSFILPIRISTIFCKDFYKPPKELKLKPHTLIRRRLLGVPPLPPVLDGIWSFPFALIQDGKIKPENCWIEWLGGPALLIITDGNALYLERGNQFSRVVGPGMPVAFLDWYETVKAVVDLKPQIKTGDVNAWTKDGIKIKIKVRLVYQIGTVASFRSSSEKLVYPFDPLAVRHAVEYTASRYNRVEDTLEDSDWVDGAWGMARGIIAAHVSRHLLDELFLADRGAGQILSPQVGNNLRSNINNALRSRGIQATSLQILDVSMPMAVKQQRLRNWAAEKQRIIIRTGGAAEAFQIRAFEEARADAQNNLIMAIARELARIGPDPDSLLLYLGGILDQSIGDPLVQSYMTDEALITLQRLRVL